MGSCAVAPGLQELASWGTLHCMGPVYLRRLVRDISGTNNACNDGTVKAPAVRLGLCRHVAATHGKQLYGLPWVSWQSLCRLTLHQLTRDKFLQSCCMFAITCCNISTSAVPALLATGHLPCFPSTHRGPAQSPDTHALSARSGPDNPALQASTRTSTHRLSGRRSQVGSQPQQVTEHAASSNFRACARTPAPRAPHVMQGT